MRRLTHECRFTIACREASRSLQEAIHFGMFVRPIGGKFMRLITLALLGVALVMSTTLEAQEIVTTQPSGPPGMRGRGGGRFRAPGEAPPAAGREASGPTSQPAGA